ncbi:regulatory protein SUAPRGA1 [Blumeria hordei DH14]|uniref:Regulatory protein SUAPRGA1 n=1 Tax=Blumeria graminis f. sp. hordei (strain DH14) TaxID=546991 RepID=N1J8D5_BLUG1|nr:regulatory protein SUAPRGA1 [Blumeria hordei DH14]
MLSVRAIARVASSRSVYQTSKFSVATKCLPIYSSSRSHTASRPILKQISHFSVSSISRSKKAGGDEDLVAKLQSEIDLENDIKEDSSQPQSIKDYLSNSPFSITDIPGQEDVTLKRTYGDEKIQITFSIADLNMDPDPEFNDRAFGDEEEEGSEESNEQKTPEESEEEPALPNRLNIIVEKPNQGALLIDAAVQDAVVMIENVFHYPDAAHAYAKSPEKLHERQDLYVGPPFGNLDEDLQVLFERYLDERGINSALALFVPDYIDAKEQKEYVRWLENVKKFVKA